MKRFASYCLYTLLLAAIACACSDTLDIKQDFAFDVRHLPVQDKIKMGETAEIRLQLVREGRWNDAKYYMRYFQPQGKGELRTEEGMLFLPNDLYGVPKETFRLYYTSRSEEQQVVDLYFLSDSGRLVTLSFSFNNVNDEEGD